MQMKHAPFSCVTSVLLAATRKIYEIVAVKKNSVCMITNSLEICVSLWSVMYRGLNDKQYHSSEKWCRPFVLQVTSPPS